MLVIEKLNARKYFILRGFVWDIIRPSKDLPAQSQLLKHKNKGWKLFRIKNEDDGIISVFLLFTVNIFQTCSNCWLWKDQHFWRQDQVYHALCCSILKSIIKYPFNLYIQSPTDKSMRNLCEGVYFRLWFYLKRCSSQWKWPAVHLSF